MFETNMIVYVKINKNKIEYFEKHCDVDGENWLLWKIQRDENEEKLRRIGKNWTHIINMILSGELTNKIKSGSKIIFWR